MHRLAIEDLLLLAEELLGESADRLLLIIERLALLAMIEFLRRNGASWPATVDQGEVAEAFERLAARDLDEPGFAEWVASKLR